MNNFNLNIFKLKPVRFITLCESKIIQLIPNTVVLWNGRICFKYLKIEKIQEKEKSVHECQMKGIGHNFSHPRVVWQGARPMALLYLPFFVFLIYIF